jgi:hypothetical protein
MTHKRACCLILWLLLAVQAAAQPLTFSGRPEVVLRGLRLDASTFPAESVAVSVSDCGRLVVENAEIIGHAHGLYTNGVKTVEIRRCRFISRDTPEGTGTALRILKAESTIIEGCTIVMPDTSAWKGNSHTGIVVNLCPEVRIVGNTVRRGYTGIVAKDCAGLTLVADNYCVDQAAKRPGPAQGIYCQGIRDALIRGNTLGNVDYTGIAVVDGETGKSARVSVVGNTIHGKAASFYGVLLRGDDCLVSSNVITGGLAFGVQVQEGGPINVVDNVIRIDGDRGIVFYTVKPGFSNGNLVRVKEGGIGLRILQPSEVNRGSNDIKP